MNSLLALEQTTFSAGKQTLLGPVDLEVPKGDFLAVIGPNGSGKTTLLRLLAGMLNPTRGRVLLDQGAIGALRRAAVARRLSYVPQNSWTDFELTVFDAVAMGRLIYCRPFQGLARDDFDAIHEALERADLKDLVRRTLPTLSGGERQRVFIARALAQEAEILLLDEPTTSLDIGHQLELMALLAELNAAGKTVVAAMHDLRLVWDVFLRSVLLDRGRLVADGPTREVLCSPASVTAFQVHLEQGVDERLHIRRL